MSDPVGYLQAMDAAACQQCSTRKEMKAEIERLQKRITGLLESNNRFEEMARTYFRAQTEINNKYQNLRRLVLLEAADHCATYGLNSVDPKWLAEELRMKARG